MRARALGALLAATTLAACALSPAGTPRMVLGAAGSQANVGGALALRVRLGVAASRALLAAVGDVARLEVRAATPGAERTETIPGAALSAGAAAIELANLVPGPYALSVQAFDAAGAVIGRGSSSAQVVAGQRTDLVVAVALAPGLANPDVVRPTAAGPSDWFGGLDAEIGFETPAPVRYPPIEAQFLQGVPGIDAFSVAPMQDGSVWATTGLTHVEAIPTAAVGAVVRITPAGVVEDRTPAHPVGKPGEPFRPLSLEAGPGSQRLVVVPQYPASDATPVATGYVFDAAGAQQGPSGFQAYGLAVLDAVHRVWAQRENPSVGSSAGKLSRYGTTTTPTVAETFRTGYTLKAVAADAAGNVWARHTTSMSSETPGYLSLYGPSGARVAEYPDPTEEPVAIHYTNDAMACDPAGNVWIPEPGWNRATKVSPAGAVVARAHGTLAFSNVHVDPTGGVWAYNRSTGEDDGNEELAHQTPDHSMVTRFAADGTVLAYYHLGDDVHVLDLAVTADGTMWVATVTTGILKVKVDVPFAP